MAISLEYTFVYAPTLDNLFIGNFAPYCSDNGRLWYAKMVGQIMTDDAIALTGGIVENS